MGDDFDVQVGKRLRRRRRILGLTQQQVAEAVGIGFHQIQKYECGANRMTASRLYKLAAALNVPVGYFFEGVRDGEKAETPLGPGISPDVLTQQETLELIRAYYQLGEKRRRRLLELAKALNEETATAAA